MEFLAFFHVAQPCHHHFSCAILPQHTHTTLGLQGHLTIIAPSALAVCTSTCHRVISTLAFHVAFRPLQIGKSFSAFTESLRPHFFQEANLHPRFLLHSAFYLCFSICHLFACFPFCLPDIRNSLRVETEPFLIHILPKLNWVFCTKEASKSTHGAHTPTHTTHRRGHVFVYRMSA